MPLSSKYDLYDLHLHQTVIETDHELVQQSYVFINILVSTQIALCCDGSKPAAPITEIQ